MHCAPSKSLRVSVFILSLIVSTLLSKANAQIPISLLLSDTNTWPTEFPSINFPGPVISSLSDFKSKQDGFTFKLGFRAVEGGGVQGLVSGRDSFDTILGMSMTNALVIRVKDENGTSIPVRIYKTTPEQLAPKQAFYAIDVKFVRPPIGRRRNLVVSAETVFREQQSKFRDAHALWISNSIPVLFEVAEALKRPTNQYAAFWHSVQRTARADTNREIYISAATNAIGSAFQTTAANKIVAKTGTLAEKFNLEFSDYLSIFRDDSTTILTNRIASLKKWLEQVRAGGAGALPALPDGLDASTLDELFWLMVYRYSRFEGGTQRRNRTTGEIEVVTEVTEEFLWTGRIAGFEVLVDKLEALPEAEAASNFGAGIATHFHVFRVSLVNTNASSVLIYGDQISVQCKVRDFSFYKPKDFRYLVSSCPERDLYLTQTNGWTSARFWKTSENGRCRGEVFSVQERFLARPYTLSFLIRGFDYREFHTLKATIFRSLAVVADTAAALIPLVGNQGYSDGAGVFSGIFVPGAKKLFGDATEVQRQAFLLESMPNYLELERGQSVSRYIYFPKFGLTAVAEDRVRFITEFGNAQEVSVNVAVLLKPTEETE